MVIPQLPATQTSLLTGHCVGQSVPTAALQALPPDEVLEDEELDEDELDDPAPPDDELDEEELEEVEDDEDEAGVASPALPDWLPPPHAAMSMHIRTGQPRRPIADR